ncbi:MAG TPA: S8/S53 family peptidase [Trebonia sp.]
MTEQTGENSGLVPYVRAQVDYIINEFDREFDGNGPAIKVVPEHGGVGFMYAEGQLLVRDEYLDRVLVLLDQQDDSGGKQDDSEPDDRSPGVATDRGQFERVIRGVVLLRLRQRDGQPTVPDALDRIDAAFGTGVATPNHVLTVAPEAGPCPATEPECAYQDTEPYPGVCRTNGGAGVTIYVADTGLLADAPGTCPWLHGVTGDVDPLPPAVNGVQAIPPYTGHGTFVAGVVRCMAPDAEVIVTNAFAVAGSTLESDLVQRLDAALAHPVDIFHLSITVTTRKNQILIGVERWLELLRDYKGTVCVVAAGNDGTNRRHWPAASPGTVSVGALAADWRSRARFSDFGSWVDVYAPGRDLVNAFATGTYTCHVPPYTGQERKFYGMAKWSGTSFSTPIVTGLIAARMSRTGENGQQAAAALLAEARCQAIPGVGPILLPTCEQPCREPSCREPSCRDCRGERPRSGSTCGCHR